MKVRKILDALLSIPKTVIVNFRLLELRDAIHFPIFVHWNTKIDSLDGKVILGSVKTGIVKIGFSGSFALGGGKSYLKLDGECHVKGACSIGRGVQLVVSPSGTLVIGDNFSANANCLINVSRLVQFGRDCLLAWNVSILDGDGHKIIRTSREKKDNRIYIGDHVWLCSDVKILKGASVEHDSVIAANSIITKRLSEGNVLVGNNNRILERNISWKK